MRIIKISLAEQARNALLEQIASGKLAAGTRLTEEAISAEFAISRTPVRDALAHLASDGLLEKLPGRGYQVKKTDTDEIAELMSCRTEVELNIFSTDFENLSPEALRDLRQELLQFDPEAEDAALEAGKIDDALHNIINSACRNRYWREIHNRLLQQRLPYRDIRNIGGADRLRQLKLERLQLLDAILSGDKSAALRELKNHLEAGQLDIIAAISKKS